MCHTESICCVVNTANLKWSGLAFLCKNTNSLSLSALSWSGLCLIPSLSREHWEGVRREYTLFGKPVHHGEPCTHIHIFGGQFIVANLFTGMFLGGGGKPENPEKNPTQTRGENVKLGTDSNLSSRSNYGSWSYEETVIPATPLCHQIQT